MNALIAEFSLDTNRLYITGLSMGGIGTWTTSANIRHVRRRIPMSGSGTTSSRPG